MSAGRGERQTDAGRGGESPAVIPPSEIAAPAPFRPGRLLRWLLVPPAGLLGWYAGVAAGLALHALAESFCDPADRVSGACVAGWFAAAADAAVHAGVAVAAALVVLLPALVAPGMRGTVAWTAFGFGAAAAGNLAWMTGAWSEMLVAVTVGFAALWLVLRRWRGDGRASGG